eukprot:CAMPEP_0178504872 /NCGR_PEP_ID=MMETSP0696-20121128/18821_1 /TAXON_ID=265572 /ORGANISM="Extubocellulus spinifer, Strain CCMP396" /LENGTH=279 /DNA_ID=CAMNT_0020134129 /DNA_START=524 /DNA_END=1359 /DNA_ORIENTATION=-
MSDEQDRDPVSSRIRRGAAPADTGSVKGLPRTPRLGRAVGGRGGNGRRGHTGRGYTRGRRGNRRGRGGRGGISPSLGPTAARRGTGDDNTVAPSTAPEAMASEKTTPSLRSASNGTEHPVDTAVTATDEDQASGGVSTSPSSNPGVGDENTASSPTSTGVSAKEEATPSPLYAGGNTARLLDKAEKSATAIVDEGMCVRAAATAAAAVQAAAAAAPSADGLRANPDVARSPMFSATTLSAERLSIVSASEDLTEDTDVGPSAAVDETQLTSRTDRSDET